MKDLLSPPQSGKLLIITVGNPLRKDDGVGPYIAHRLKDIRKDRIIVLDAGQYPEAVIEEAVSISPTKTVIIDTADFGGVPGEIRVITKDMVSEKTFSTHRFPLTIIAKILKMDTGSEVYFVGIQPKDVSFGEGISHEVKTSADELVKEVLKYA